jgi:hypothetical protein
MRRQRGRTKQKKPTRNNQPHLSLFTGVTRELGNNRRKPWKVAITTGGKRKHIARFEYENDAAQAYADALLIFPL